VLSGGKKAGLGGGNRGGRRDGVAVGAYQKARETAKLMAERKYPLSEILLMTGLSEAEIEKL